MEGEGRKQNYTHAIWADKVELLWKQLKDKHRLLIPEVRASLPQGIIDCLPEGKDMHTNFSVFLQAVHDIPIEKAIRHTNELQELCDMKLQISSLSEVRAPPSPMSQMTQCLATSSIYLSYLQYSYQSPSQQLNTIPGPTATVLTTSYILPHCRQTPLHISMSMHQQPTPVSYTNPFQDDGTTPHPLNSFYQNLQSTPSPTPQPDNCGRSLTVVNILIYSPFSLYYL